MIGTLATRAAAGPADVDVVTGDRDLFQLVDDAAGVRVLYTGRGVRNLEVVDEAWLRAKYGIRDGAGYADLAVLRGDPSDGLPGVAGIGEKTAAALLNRYGTLDGAARRRWTPGPPTSPRARRGAARGPRLPRGGAGGRPGRPRRPAAGRRRPPARVARGPRRARRARRPLGHLLQHRPPRRGHLFHAADPAIRADHAIRVDQ